MDEIAQMLRQRRNAIQQRVQNPELYKGKALPNGTIRKRPNGNFIKTSQGWKYHSPLDSNKSQDKETDEPDEDVENQPIDKIPASKLASRLFTLVNKVGGAKTFGEQMALISDAGIKDPQKVVELTNADLSDVLQYMDHKGIQAKTQDFDIQAELAKLENKPAVENALPKPPVEERWDAYRFFLNMVVDGFSKSLIAYGTGGVGKTYNLDKVFESRGLEEYHEDKHLSGTDGYDFVKVTGKSTPIAMYKELYEHNGKTIVFDDCDSVLEHDTSINILKGALDTSGNGTISYKSGKKIKDDEGNDVPQRFDFKGKIAFVSNLKKDQMPQPLQSRAMTVDLTMTAQETVDIMKTFVQKMPFQDNKGNPIDVSPENRTAAIEFLDNIKDDMNINDLNARTLGQIALIKEKLANKPEVDWRKYAYAMLT